jgi:outer membrane biosynthesis protein TonB
MNSVVSFSICAVFTVLCACASPPNQSVDTSDASRIEALREEQFRLLAQVRYELAIMERTLSADSASDDTRAKRRERYDALRREFRRIEDSVQSGEEGGTFYISAGAKDPRVAEYYDRLRKRIESAGTSHFPKEAGTSIYGTAAVLVSMRRTGEVTAVDVAESSSAAIRLHVQALMQGLSPMEPFPSGIASGATRVLLVTTFNYTDNR